MRIMERKQLILQQIKEHFTGNLTGHFIDANLENSDNIKNYVENEVNRLMNKVQQYYHFIMSQMDSPDDPIENMPDDGYREILYGDVHPEIKTTIFEDFPNLADNN